MAKRWPLLTGNIFYHTSNTTRNSLRWLSNHCHQSRFLDGPKQITALQLKHPSSITERLELIQDFTRTGRSGDASNLLRSVLRDREFDSDFNKGVKLVVLLLKCCGDLQALEEGRWVHRHIFAQLQKSNQNNRTY